MLWKKENENLENIIVANKDYFYLSMMKKCIVNYADENQAQVKDARGSGCQFSRRKTNLSDYKIKSKIGMHPQVER